VLRGEVYELRPTRRARGHEQRGRRFGVVLQADELLSLSTVVVAPTSASARAASFRPEIRVRGERTRVLVEQLGAVDRSRLGEPLAVLGRSELEELEHATRLVLGR
jgi:mRNA interferase MazF